MSPSQPTIGRLREEKLAPVVSETKYLRRNSFSLRLQVSVTVPSTHSIFLSSRFSVIDESWTYKRVQIPLDFANH